jgi:transposase
MYIRKARHDYFFMVEAGRDLSGSGDLRLPRRRRSAVERRRIVEETFESGSSVARVARKYGVNANQVFQWRTLYRKGGLGGTPTTPVRLLPVSVAEEAEVPAEADEQAASTVAGTIRIKLAGHASISVEGSVDPELIRVVLECLRR